MSINKESSSLKLGERQKLELSGVVVAMVAAPGKNVNHGTMRKEERDEVNEPTILGSVDTVCEGSTEADPTGVIAAPLIVKAKQYARPQSTTEHTGKAGPVGDAELGSGETSELDSSRLTPLDEETEQATHQRRKIFGKECHLWDDYQDRVLLDCINSVYRFSGSRADSGEIHDEWTKQVRRGLVPERSKAALAMRISKHWAAEGSERLTETQTRSPEPFQQKQAYVTDPDRPLDHEEIDGRGAWGKRKRKREISQEEEVIVVKTKRVVGEGEEGPDVWGGGARTEPKERSKVARRSRGDRAEVAGTPMIEETGILEEFPGQEEEVREMLVDETEEGVGRGERRRLFNVFFREALPQTSRIAPRKPRWRLKDSELQFIDGMVREKIARKRGIRTVTAALYAGAKVLERERSDRFAKKYEKFVHVTEGIVSQCREFVEEDRAITKELKRRKNRGSFNNTAKEFKRNLKARETGGMRTKDLKERLVQNKERVEVLERKLDMLKRNRKLKNRQSPSTRTILQPSTNQVECSAEQVKDFWSTIIGKAGKECKIPPVFEEWRRVTQGQKVKSPVVDKETWKVWWEQTLKKVRPWKAPGPDGVHAYYWKRIPTARKFLSKWVWGKVMIGKKPIPSHVSAGRVTMIPKGTSAKPEDMRPIACLNISCKVLNAMIWKISEKTLAPMIPEAQRALRKKEYNTLHTRILDASICSDFKYRKGKKKELHVGWVDFSKAFDSISHQYLGWLLEATGMRAAARRSYTSFLQNLTVMYEVTTESGISRSSPLLYRRGVPQGDTLSPRLFCLALAPISYALEQAVKGYTFSHERLEDPYKITHLLYVDDLKVYAQTSDDLNNALRTVRCLSEKVGLQFNQKKCSTAHLGGKYEKFEQVPVLELGQTYKYLGIEQWLGTDESTAEERIEAEVVRRTKKVWESDMNFPEKVSMFNATVAPVVRYYAGNHCATGGSKAASIRAWAEALDITIRGHLSDSKAHYSKCSKYRPYLPPSEMGLGLKSMIDEVEEATVYSGCYLLLNKNLVKCREIAVRHAKRGKRTMVTDFDKVLKRYPEIDVDRSQTGVIRVGDHNYKDARDAARVIAKIMRASRVKTRLDAWALCTAGSMVITADIDKELSGNWIKAAYFEAKVVRDVVGLQEHQVLFRGHPGNGYKECRFCDEIETGQHVVSVCDTFRPSLMVSRHNAVCREIYDHLRDQYKLNRVPAGWVPPPMYESIEGVQFYWDHLFQTKAVLKYRKPDIVVVDPGKKTILIIEVAVTWLTSLEKTTEWKYAKYALDGNAERRSPPFSRGPALATELQYSRGFRVVVIPIVIGTGGEVHESFTEYIQKIPGCENPGRRKRLVTLIQKRAIRGTVGIMRAHLANDCKK